MAELESHDQNLVAARNFLRTSLEKSKAIASALEKTGPRLEEINQRLPSLEAALQPVLLQKCAIIEVRGRISRAVGPVAAVLKVFDAVQGLEKSLLSDSCLDLPGYLSAINRIEEALRFLAGNCRLAIQWLEDTVEFLKDNAVTDERYHTNLKKSLKILRELEATEKHARLHGGLVSVAFDKLEIEFRRLLTENSIPLLMDLSSSSIEEKQACIAPSPLPGSVIKKLQAILERLKASNRLEKCVSIYVEVRVLNVRASLQALDLDYLGIPFSNFDSVQIVEDYIDQWGKHLEFAVRYLFELEYKLCNEVFEKIGLDLGAGCFAEIATKSGILDFLQFGSKVTRSKEDPIKLLKLLDIFATLNKLRSDFNRLFSGKACIEIQTLTRNLIKVVVNGACEIFWELPGQVGSQRQTPPPADGSVPRLVSFVTEYCNELLGDNYKPILTQVLAIHQNWKHEKFHEGLVTDKVHNIIEELELNLEPWSKACEDITLSSIFMMNNHWHFYATLKGTWVGDLMGDAWLRKQEQRMDYYLAVYLGETWGKLPSLLSQEGRNLPSGGKQTACQAVKERLKAFNEVFDEIYRKQSNYVLSEESFREKIRQVVVQAIVPAYRSYLQNYGTSIELDTIAGYKDAESLENMLNALFQPRIGKCGSTKHTHLIGKVRSVVTNRFCSTPFAT